MGMKSDMKTKNHSVLERLYYNLKSSSGLSGINKLYKEVRNKKYNISKKEVEKWLSTQPAYSLHRPIRKKFRRNKTLVYGIDEQWQIDLIDMQGVSRYNKSYKYLMNVIDVLSKFGWSIPIKDKKSGTLEKAFSKLLKKSNRKPMRLQSDKGGEFIGKKFQTMLEKNDIVFFTTQNEDTKCAVVERWNRTMKEKMFRYFTAKDTYKYIDILDDLVESYNKSYHRTIKMAPIDVNILNQDVVWTNTYGNMKNYGKKFKFNVGDAVRIALRKAIFQKGYEQGWSDELFYVTQQIERDPVVYKVKDYSNNVLVGTFYERELQKVDISEDPSYHIEKILRRKPDGSKTLCLVKWRGYDSRFNSWVDSEDIETL